MNQLFGNDIIKISAPQDRSELLFVLLDDKGSGFAKENVRFFNFDKSPINIDFSDLSIGMLFDPDTGEHTLGEFEEVKCIENGFEVLGDFGIIWVFCDSSSPRL